MTDINIEIGSLMHWRPKRNLENSLENKRYFMVVKVMSYLGFANKYNVIVKKYATEGDGYMNNIGDAILADPNDLFPIEQATE